LLFRLLRNLLRMELESSSVVCARLVKLVRKFVAHESSLLVFPTSANEAKSIQAHLLKSTLYFVALCNKCTKVLTLNIGPRTQVSFASWH
jgi:hypothetical protein